LNYSQDRAGENKYDCDDAGWLRAWKEPQWRNKRKEMKPESMRNESKEQIKRKEAKEREKMTEKGHKCVNEVE
jgi:hypothetical protein